MARNVYILGAGASTDCGAPVMSNFFDFARRLHRSGLDEPDKVAFDSVFDFIADLQKVFHKSTLNLQNIEEILSAVEMAVMLGQIEGRDLTNLENVRDSVVHLIRKTLELSIRYPVNGNQDILPNSTYSEFAILLSVIHENEGAAILTFNYDYALDFALERSDIPVTYALDGSGKTNQLPLLKLHGSLSWFRCEACGAIIPISMHQILRHSVKMRRPINASAPVTFSIYDFIKHRNVPCNKCNATNWSKEPLILPPSFNKTSYHQKLTHVWQRAAKELSEAERIYIIGYSLPKTDMFFRYLFALGTLGKSHLERLWIIDKADSVRENYKDLPGAGISHAYKFIPNDFRNAIANLTDEIRGIYKVIGN